MAGSAKKPAVDKLGCPIVKDTVTVTVKYDSDESGQDKLVYFGCNMEGKCGIPDWDPCPLYVTYRGKKRKKKT